MTEIRVGAWAGVGLEIRAESNDQPTEIGGLAIPVGVWSEPIGGVFREMIKPGAFDHLLEDIDLPLLRNHDRDSILARTKAGNLRLDNKKDGLHWRSKGLPDTTLVRDTVADIRAGNIVGQSFAFSVDERAGEKWDYPKNVNYPRRTVLRFESLVDVSVVTDPAYGDATGVAVRSTIPGSLPDLAAVRAQRRAALLKARQWSANRLWEGKWNRLAN